MSCPNWVCGDGVTYKKNNAYVVIRHDGMDPVFGIIEELIVIGGDMVLFCVLNCNVRLILRSLSCLCCGPYLSVVTHS